MLPYLVRNGKRSSAPLGKGVIPGNGRKGLANGTKLTIFIDIKITSYFWEMS